jgi:pimeloyl-ACP methyl ester carboxylesterase
MPKAKVNGEIELEYDTTGDPRDPALVLIMGFSAQMTQWEDSFVKLLADGGRYVIRFDNRDCGLSTKLHGVPANSDEVVKSVMLGDPMPEVAYTLSDMAADTVGLLDHLAIEKAHMVGASMGGMIAQTIAIEHPHRVHTLVSIMSIPGDLASGQPTPEAAEALLATPPSERQAYIDFSPNWMIWHSKRYRDEERTRANAARDYDRSFYPEGSPRQLAAIYASGDRTEALRQLQVPTLVIHGLEDILLPADGGQRVAELVPGAHLMLMKDMGHDLPEPLWPLVVGSILGHTNL